MSVVLVEIEPIRSTTAVEPIVLIEDLDAFAAAATPGCGDDNPYQ